ncbi:hypothetical protein GCM10011514_53170 [Emticicia aquatilis]|uniref:HTH tetR-type domain-containing protein n=1 Tax=Emticicia aquatilis TaxID=1537369 RepID=A0A916ZAJ1_9BACT|nr:TetR/AcrR family transcriptional regulator [Emticicia aquatilis]GGD82467.1 hypothetical protein GCM10011514_53170 [Emticicia aquatilis]
MPKIDHNTKEKILIAAEKVFHRSGFKGTRTTAIAEEAGISRTMLHYYYSTKEDLFQEVLNKTLGAVIPHLSRLLGQEMDLEHWICHIIDTMCGLFEEKPTFPNFVANIINESPDVVMMLATNVQDDIPSKLDALLAVEKQKGTVIENITGEDLILNIYSLCAVPYLGIPYIKAKENRNDEQMLEFLKQRREKIKVFVLHGIRK